MVNMIGGDGLDLRGATARQRKRAAAVKRAPLRMVFVWERSKTFSTSQDDMENARSRGMGSVPPNHSLISSLSSVFSSVLCDLKLDLQLGRRDQEGVHHGEGEQLEVVLQVEEGENYVLSIVLWIESDPSKSAKS